MRNEDLLTELDRRLSDQKELIDAKFTHLSAIVRNGFESAGEQRTEIIDHQKRTNGRVTQLEHDTTAEMNENQHFRRSLLWKLVGSISIAVILSVIAYEIGLLELFNLIK